jgi:acyl-CoA reductase-like NAD-dependent aldehyde dehydrogenase
VQSASPLTGEVRATYPITPLEAVPDLMARARVAQKRWQVRSLHERLQAMRAIQDSMYRHLDQIIDTMINEVGKPRFDALVEIFPTFEVMAHQRRIAPKVLRAETRNMLLIPYRNHKVEYRPYGVVAVIAPWNFPLILSLTPIYAALLTGNAVIYKPSEYAPHMGEVIRKVIHDAGIDPDLMQTVQGYGDLGAAIIKARPDKIAFTGSVPTGRKVAAMAGELLIPCTLELGGKDAAIVLSDADIDRTAAGLVWAGMHNAGQACLSIERIYVERGIADTLVEKMLGLIAAHIHVDGSDRRTLGAINNDAQMKIIEGQVREAVEQGARLICGGKRIEGTGRFYEPTLITDVTPEMRILKEETFGPVIVITPVDNAEEAIHLANDTRFGLTASVWTSNERRGLEIARRLVAGNVGVNDHIISASVPSLPWGGVGDSGYGRQRGSEGLLDMVWPQALSTDRISLPREPYWFPHTEFKHQFFRRALRLLYADSFWGRIRAIFK